MGILFLRYHYIIFCSNRGSASLRGFTTYGRAFGGFEMDGEHANS